LGDEFRGYQRKDGQIVKLNDGLMSATRIATMMRRYAKQGQIGSRFSIVDQYRGQPYMCKGVDFDVWDI
jgi:hypothetical protein